MSSVTSTDLETGPRTLVKSEEWKEHVLTQIRMNLRPTSKLKERAKVKAISSAQNEKNSSLGGHILKEHARKDRSWSCQLERFEKEKGRFLRCHSLEVRRFASKSWTLNHHPLILTERKPSSLAQNENQLNLDRQMPLSAGHVRPQSRHKKLGHVRPQSRHKKPGTKLATIDALALVTSHKRNLWEEEPDDEGGYKSTTTPVLYLTGQEIRSLKSGLSDPQATPESKVRVVFKEKATNSRRLSHWSRSCSKTCQNEYFFSDECSLELSSSSTLAETKYSDRKPAPGARQRTTRPARRRFSRADV